MKTIQAFMLGFLILIPTHTTLQQRSDTALRKIKICKQLQSPCIIFYCRYAFGFNALCKLSLVQIVFGKTADFLSCDNKDNLPTNHFTQVSPDGDYPFTHLFSAMWHYKGFSVRL